MFVFSSEDRSEVVNELSVLRRRLRSEQQRLEEQLLQTEWELLPSPFTDRYSVLLLVFYNVCFIFKSDTEGMC